MCMIITLCINILPHDRAAALLHGSGSQAAQEARGAPTSPSGRRQRPGGHSQGFPAAGAGRQALGNRTLEQLLRSLFTRSHRQGVRVLDVTSVPLPLPAGDRPANHDDFEQSKAQTAGGQPSRNALFGQEMGRYQNQRQQDRNGRQKELRV
jgi:hypothetical protein